MIIIYISLLLSAWLQLVTFVKNTYYWASSYDFMPRKIKLVENQEQNLAKMIIDNLQLTMQEIKNVRAKKLHKRVNDA